MKLPMLCTKCAHEQTKEWKGFSFVEIRDDGRYEFTCENGHKTITILQQQKFEILFDLGAYAILDGYYREAVSSFTSSLERFYEFYIKVIATKNGIDESTFLSSWKHVSKQSERQLGAFILLYMVAHGSTPPLLSNSNVEFRNDVIHRGKLPSKTEALSYGNDVLNVIRPILRILRKNYKESAMKVVAQYLSECRSKYENDQSVSTMGVKTILSLSFEPEADEDDIALEDTMPYLMMMKLQQKL